MRSFVQHYASELREARTTCQDGQVDPRARVLCIDDALRSRDMTLMRCSRICATGGAKAARTRRPAAVAGEAYGHAVLVYLDDVAEYRPLLHGGNNPGFSRLPSS
eukprot:s4768_g7.t1